MKKIIFIVLCLLTFNTYSQDSTNVKLSETERIIDKYSGSIKENFEKLVSNITPVAQDGFKIAVKLQIAKGIGKLLPLLLFIIFSILLLNRIKNPNEDFNHNPSNLALIYFIGCLLFFLMALVYTYSGILHLIAPEWYAIKNIIELI